MMSSCVITATILYAILLVDVCRASLSWEFTRNSTALCNDFTRAGFFHRTSSVLEKKWIIFLEGGSLCYANDNCNHRYFQSYIRDRYSSDEDHSDFDAELAWSETGGADQSLTEVVNPLMTSTYCFRNETEFFSSNSDTNDLYIEGNDVLSSDCAENPTFCKHGHVLIPYCSSDLWLGNEDSTSRQHSSLLKQEPCDCWDQNCFQYNPTSEDLQFTFRGQTIFRSVLETLDSMYNLQTASEIVLVGSSAGGVGVLNSAKWMREEFQNVNIKIITDSSWFINFHDGISQQTIGLDSKETTLFNIVRSYELCNDTRLGYPCCMISQCIISESSTTTGETYFPQDVPLFIITSIYDVFLLAQTLSEIADVDQASSVGLVQQVLTTLGEYGGIMNASLIDTANAASQSDIKFSYYATQCLQHTYLSTSTLRTEDGLIGDGGVEISSEIAEFEHRVESGVWSDQILAYYDGQGYTIRDAISYWYLNVSDTEESVVFRDVCSGPHCSNVCPEVIILVSDNSGNMWSRGSRITIAVIVLIISVTCLVIKLYSCLWLKHHQQSQLQFLTNINLEKNLAVKTKLPHCTDAEAISVACLDIYYHVTIHEKIQKKQENKEVYTPVALPDLKQERDSESYEVTSCEKDESSPDIDCGNRFKRLFGTKKKTILNGITAYFNPGELIAIMGPSGSGKTTFLDLLTGRRQNDNVSGKVFVNGFSLEENHNWYISNTGYVLQLAAPYYEELTVRENLTLAAWVKLHISSREKFQRVEQVMEVTGLIDLADTAVGGATGPGLSGGQKRRLAVALQLLKLPSVIFLDEPTSGLDSASSIELLTHLNALAASNRTVVLTIHQPRLEIFHMFHRIIVLSEGKVSYQGVPEKTYEVFVNALQSAFLAQGVDIPPLEDHNPADVIMDMLGDQKMRMIINDYYDSSGEQDLVRKAVSESWTKEQQIYNDGIDSSKNNGWAKIQPFRFGTRHAGRTHNYFFKRLAALEARAVKRTSLTALLYLPIIFFIYGFLLGTVYFQTTEPFLIMSGFCVYSVASALFMFPALYTFYERALVIYSFEHADGAGRATDLVIQPFVRFVTIAFFPVIICAAVLYFILVDINRWNISEFFQIAMVNIALNQTWTALLIWLILTFPHKCIRLSPVISALAGFTSGFFIPINSIPWWYRWLSFINPNYYGFSATAVILLSEFESDCERNGGSELECFVSSGDYVLGSFSFSSVNPYSNIVVLLGMTVFFLVIAGVSNWVRYLKPGTIKKQFLLVLMKLKMPSGNSLNTKTVNGRTSEVQMTSQKRRKSICLKDDQTHTVWKPEHRISLENEDIYERRKKLQNRVWATQHVLKVSSDDGNHQRHTDPVQRRKWQRAIRNAIRNQSSATSLSFHDIVSQYYATTISTSDSQLVASQVKSDTRTALRLWKSQYMDDMQQPTHSSNPQIPSTIPEETELTEESSSV